MVFRVCYRGVRFVVEGGEKVVMESMKVVGMNGGMRVFGGEISGRRERGGDGGDKRGGV